MNTGACSFYFFCKVLLNEFLQLLFVIYQSRTTASEMPIKAEFWNIGQGLWVQARVKSININISDFIIPITGVSS